VFECKIALWCLTGIGIISLNPSTSCGQNSNACVSVFNSGLYSQFTVVEGAQYIQTNDTPVPNGKNVWVFEAVIDLSTNLSAGLATVNVPSRGIQTMRRISPQQFLVALATNSVANMLNAYPQGTYQFAISNKTWSVSLPVGTALPNIPTLSNYTNAQNIDPSKDFMLLWAPLTTGNSTDQIIADVRDTNGVDILRTARYGCAGDLEGTASGFMIPANALSSNQNYTVSLTFVKISELDTNSLPNTELLSGTEILTIIHISTGASSTTTLPNPTAISNLEWLPGGSIRFDLQTTPGRNFAVQFNPKVENPGGWTTLMSGTAAAALTGFTNNVPTTSKTGFYRAFEN
jgi:hypothetical protein